MMREYIFIGDKGKFMKKLLIIMLSLIISLPLIAQDNTKPQRDLTDTSDEGWYFSNHFLGRWNHFGALYQGLRQHEEYIKIHFWACKKREIFYRPILILL